MSLAAQDITVGYDRKVISEHPDLEVPDGRFTAISAEPAKQVARRLGLLPQSSIAPPVAGTPLVIPGRLP
ncbi:hypothetical protein [Paractinoplanes durhamensis]|uniref:Uncharacterized protein n=1 Tax=Paractinoplanes durhamensis TaxID=113563 RepID=A0ABQ3Z8F0_9ACTN|nr:hypothetical protein [Actinoplanes durhamensis]GIE06103.1 hypothetical protein Adu01nite_74530 [Actinoplanes durhamensis]